MAAVDTTRLWGDGVDGMDWKGSLEEARQKVLGRVGEDGRRGPSGRKVD